MKYMSIRAKLCIFLLLIIIPLVILQIVSVETKKKRNIEYQVIRCEDYSRAVGAAFVNYVNDLWDTELAIGQAAAMQKQFNRELIESYMRDILSKQRAIKRYNIIDPDGSIIASTFKKPPDVSLADREYIIKINEGNEKVISGVIEGRIENDILITVVRGIWRDGKLMFIISAAVDITELGQCLPQYDNDKTCVTGIIDKNGMLVYLSKGNDFSYDQRKIESGSNVLKALKGDVVKCDKNIPKTADGSYIGACVPIPEIGWACYNAVSVGEIMNNFKNYIQSGIIYFIILSVAYIVTLASFIKRVLEPLDSLKNASDAISNGDLSVRTNISGHKYIEEASAAFDKMADHIQSMEANRLLFLQTSAHELRNPITSIKGITSLIQMKIESGKPVQEIASMMSILNKEVDRLSQLIGDIVEAVRVQKAGFEIRTSFRKVNIVDVVISALRPFQVSQSCHNFIFHKVSSSPVFVLGDSERLGDVMRNLLSNAVKYSPGSGDIIVSIENKENNVTISVKDNGIGIPEGQIDRIFDSFYRADNLKGNDPGGMGLGLYICRDIIKKHGGSIWAANCEGGGSIFYIRLPLYK